MNRENRQYKNTGQITELGHKRTSPISRREANRYFNLVTGNSTYGRKPTGRYNSLSLLYKQWTNQETDKEIIIERFTRFILGNLRINPDDWQEYRDGVDEFFTYIEESREKIRALREQ